MTMRDEDDIWRKLQEMDNKLDLMQGDVNTLATINKEDKKDELQNLFKRKFGQSKTRRRIWYYADKKRTAEEIADLSGLSKSQIYNYTREMREKSLIVKTETGDVSRYCRQEITEGIGLEKHVEEYVDDL